MSERKEFRQTVSLRKLNDAFIDWFKMAHLNNEYPSASDFVLEEVNKSIKRYIIRFPIQHISISIEFWIGKVFFSFLKREDFDKMEAEFREIHGDGKQNPIEEWRNYFQGHVTADVIITAESGKAIELGLSEVKKSLAVLRFFSPSAIDSKSHSPFCLHQLNYFPSYHIFTFESNNSLSRYTILPKVEAPLFWSINKKEKERITEAGMYHFDQLLMEKKPSEFEEMLINSLFLFEKALLAEVQQEKLVYLITCLESLLLKDQGESINKSVGQRLSFITSNEITERKKIIEILSEAHRNRSSFIHHGQKNKINDEVIQYTQIGLWITICRMTFKREKFKNKNDFLNFIDDAILSGKLEF